MTLDSQDPLCLQRVWPKLPHLFPGGAWPGPRHRADHEVWQHMARAPSESICPHGLTEAGWWPGPRSSFPPVITPFATHLCNAECQQAAQGWVAG